MIGRLIPSTDRGEIRTRSDRPADNWAHCDTMLRWREQVAKGGKTSHGGAAEAVAVNCSLSTEVEPVARSQNPTRLVARA